VNDLVLVCRAGKLLGNPISPAKLSDYTVEIFAQDRSTVAAWSMGNTA
jgi:hypothetical protein